MSTAHLEYFAYGSNLLTRRLRAPERVDSARFVAVATLDGFILKFNKKSRDGSGKCTIFETSEPGHRVCGVIYAIDPSQKPAMDRAEGLGSDYYETNITVKDATGKTYEPLTYIANPETLEDGLMPYHWYKDFVLRGAEEHHLPADYIALLKAVKSVTDPIRSRAHKNRQILCADA